MNLRWAALLLGLIGTTSAQELLFLGPRLDDLWASRDHTLWIQSGTRLVACEARGGRWVVARGGPGSPSPYAEQMARAEFFDVAKEAVFVDRQRAWKVGAEARGATIRPALRRPLGALAQRLPLILDAERWAAPARSRTLVFGAGESPLELATETGGVSELGWGIGDDLVVSEAVPHLIPVRLGSKETGLLVGAMPRFFVHYGPELSERRALAIPPLDDEEGVLDFPFEIAPVVADVDADGADELLLADPSAGALYLYGDLGTPEPSQVILAGGQLLSVHATDLDGDGLPDLALLRVPSLGVMAQLAVIQEGRLGVELLVYRGLGATKAKPFGRSPTWRQSFDLPIEIAIENRVRRARFPAIAAPVHGPALLLARPGEALTLRPLEDGADARSGTAVLPAGRGLRPFSVTPLAKGRVAFGWLTPDGGRVYQTSIRED